MFDFLMTTLACTALVTLFFCAKEVLPSPSDGIQATTTPKYRCLRCDTWCLWQTEESLHAQENMCAECFDDD